jgi:hypothetical protein
VAPVELPPLRSAVETAPTREWGRAAQPTSGVRAGQRAHPRLHTVPQRAAQQWAGAPAGRARQIVNGASDRCPLPSAPGSLAKRPRGPGRPGPPCNSAFIPLRLRYPGLPALCVNVHLSCALGVIPSSQTHVGRKRADARPCVSSHGIG